MIVIVHQLLNFRGFSNNERELLPIEFVQKNSHILRRNQCLHLKLISLYTMIYYELKLVGLTPSPKLTLTLRCPHSCPANIAEQKYFTLVRVTRVFFFV